MAMKKAEMEAHYHAYKAALMRAQVDEGKGMYRSAMTSALSAWDHVDGMMQYAKKYENYESPEIAAIALVLRYAPLLLDLGSLAKLDALLDETRRISRNAAEDIPKALEKARSQVLANHRLWHKLENSPGTREDSLERCLGGSQSYWSSVVASWEKMGLITCKRDNGFATIAITTRLGQVVKGKCASCGIISEAPKAMFLEPVRCPQCKCKSPFVIMASAGV